MLGSKPLSCILQAGALLAALGLGVQARAQCSNYAVTQFPGTIVPGTDDTGNHIDDGLTPVTLPFGFNMYGTVYTSLNVCSNGNLQFATSANAWTNGCLPSPIFGGPTIAPHWDDLRTDTAGSGIFTSTTGAAPNRIFNIEWIATYFVGTGVADFEVRLYETSNQIEFIYGTLPANGASATVGVQAGPAGPFNQFSCNTALGSVTGVRFSCGISGACCTSAGCSVMTPAACAGAGGHYNGDNSPCSGCAPAGACCTGSGCSSLTQAACGAAGGAWQGAGTSCTFSSSPNLAIPDYPAPGVTDTININGSFNISHLGVAVTIPDHTYIGDLTIDLTHAGITVNLWSRLCAGDNGLDLVFDDAGSAVVCNPNGITTGTVIPASALSAFNGINAHGAWDLFVQDNQGIDIGTLTRWELLLPAGVACGPSCETADFNNDGDVGTDQDIEAFFACLAGSCCPTCETADFNMDGDVGTDQDIEAFFRVLAGGHC